MIEPLVAGCSASITKKSYGDFANISVVGNAGIAQLRPKHGPVISRFLNDSAFETIFLASSQLCGLRRIDHAVGVHYHAVTRPGRFHRHLTVPHIARYGHRCPHEGIAVSAAASLMVSDQFAASHSHGDLAGNSALCIALAQPVSGDATRVAAVQAVRRKSK